MNSSRNSLSNTRSGCRKMKCVETSNLGRLTSRTATILTEFQILDSRFSIGNKTKSRHYPFKRWRNLQQQLVMGVASRASEFLPAQGSGVLGMYRKPKEGATNRKKEKERERKGGRRHGKCQ